MVEGNECVQSKLWKDSLPQIYQKYDPARVKEFENGYGSEREL